jgi:hypothetical protein
LTFFRRVALERPEAAPREVCEAHVLDTSGNASERRKSTTRPPVANLHFQEKAMTSAPSGNALRNATIIGTILQLAMVICGHWVEWIKMNGFAIGGVAISLIAGVIYARSARVARGTSAVNGAIAGGVCALIGIAVSFALGDVPALILVVGTLGSAVGGAIGGAVAGGAR